MTAREDDMKRARDEELARQKRLLEQGGVPHRQAEREARRLVDQAAELADRRHRERR